MRAGTLWAQLWRVLLVGAAFVVASAGAFLTGLGGRPFGWLWAGAAVATVAGALAWLVWRHRAPTVAVVIVLGAAMVAGVVIARQSPPGPVVLTRALDAVELPPDAQLVEQTEGGNVLCFDVCPSVHRRYVVPSGNPDRLAEEIRTALRHAGYELQDPVDATSFTTRHDTREWYLRGRADPAPSGDDVELTLHAVATG